jgi:hypothetical protein
VGGADQAPEVPLQLAVLPSLSNVMQRLLV